MKRLSKKMTTKKRRTWRRQVLKKHPRKKKSDLINDGKLATKEGTTSQMAPNVVPKNNKDPIQKTYNTVNNPQKKKE